MVEGKYPVPEPFINVTDIMKSGKMQEEGTPHREAIKASSRRFTLDTIWPGTHLGNIRFPFSDSGEGVFIIEIHQRDKQFAQVMRMHTLENGTPVFAYQVFRNHGERGGGFEKIPELSFVDPRMPDSAAWNAMVENLGDLKGSFTLEDVP